MKVSELAKKLNGYCMDGLGDANVKLEHSKYAYEVVREFYEDAISINSEEVGEPDES